MLRSRTGIAVLVGLAVGVGGACQLIAGLEPVDGVDAPVDGGAPREDAAVDAGHDAAVVAEDAGRDAAAVDPCGASTAFPPKPPSATVPGALTVDAALRHAYFGASALPQGLVGSLCPTAAWNLDGLDTCHAAENGEAYGPEGSTCARAPKDERTCDIGEGRDNATTLMLSHFPDQLGAEGSWLDARVASGKVGMMFHITGYNGSDNDDAVSVALLALTGLQAPVAGAKPTWAPDETWGVDSTACLGGTSCTLPTYDGDGYVRDGVVYAHLDRAVIPVFAEAEIVTILVREVLVTGRLVASGEAGSFGIDHGRVAGLVALDDLSAQFGLVSIDGKPACLSSYVGLVCGSLRGYADLPIPGAVGVDGGLPPCRALSFGMSFDARPAVLGTRVTRAEHPNPCADAGPLCP